MTKAQKFMLWGEWRKAAAVLKATGKFPTAAALDDERRRLIALALGAPKSLSDWQRWTNKDVDLVLAKFLSISAPDQLKPQMKIQDGAEQHRGQIYADCWNFTSDIVDDGELMGDRLNRAIENYFTAMCRRIIFKTPDKANAAELAKVRGALELQVKRKQEKISNHTAAAEGEPF